MMTIPTTYATHSWREALKKLLGITIFLVLVYGGLLVSDPHASSANAQFNLGKEIGLYGIITLAAGMLIVTGGIDLSLGSLVCLTSTVFGLLVVKRDVPVPIAFLVHDERRCPRRPGQRFAGHSTALATVHGDAVRPVHPAQLGRWLADDTKIDNLESTLRDVIPLFRTDEFIMPVYLVILVGLGAVAAVFLHLTVHGRYFLALGSNERAARFAGV